MVVDSESPPLAHIRLFRKEILESGLLDLDFVENECHFLDGKFVEKFKTLYERDKSLAMKRLLRQILTQHPEKTDIFLPVIQDYCKDETEVLDELHLTHLRGASRNTYLELCDPDNCRMDIMGHCLKAQPFIDNLKKKYANTYAGMVRKVESLLKHQYFDAASCQILRSMPLTAVNDEDIEWWHHFLDVCDCDPRNRAFLWCIPDYHDFRSEQKAKAAPALNIIENTFDDTIADADREFRPQGEYLNHREVINDYYMIEDPEVIHLREYQEELMEGARKENTIICAPTGSGKTIVAAQIILEHLAKKKEENGNFRVVMFVPTIPLVEQQCTYLNTFMRKNHYVFGASGADGHDALGKKILSSDVVVITPQLFYNLLSDPRNDERVFISDFTLLVFDECHHCRSGHPYKKIMEVMMMFGGQHPHVIGLTASVGVGAGSTPEEFVQHMATVCANMSAKSITTVRRCKESLDKVVVPPDDRIIKVNRCKSDIRKKFVEVVTQFVEHGKKRLEKSTIFGRRERVTTFPPIDKIAVFFGFVNQLKKRVTEDPSQKIPEKNAFLRTIARIHMFFVMLNLMDVVPAKDVFEVVENYADTDEDGLKEEQDEALKNLKELSLDRAAEDLQKDILLRLKETLQEQYENAESRTLIFVSTRSLAQLLCKHLNEQWTDYGLPRPLNRGKAPVAYITSSNQSTSAGGLNAAEQSENINNFKAGYHKVLVATSVADEGLDISACNLIVKYNTSGNELTLIQRRGRARKQGSRSVLLALDGTIEKMEFESKHNELNMYATLSHINCLPKGALKLMIERKTEELKENILKEKEQEKLKCESLQQNTMVVTCTKCSQKITTTSFLRKLGKKRVAACDPEIWTKLNLAQNDKVKDGSSMENSKIICSNGDCRNDIASLGTDGNVFMPFLKASAVTLYSEEEFEDTNREGRRPVNKWSSVVDKEFYLFLINDHDRKEMCIAFERIGPEKTKSVRRSEDRKQRRNAKAVTREMKERAIVRKIFRKAREDPNAEDDDYGIATSSNVTISREEDMPLQTSWEGEVGEFQDEEFDYYDDKDFGDSGDEDFSSYSLNEK